MVSRVSRKKKKKNAAQQKLALSTIKRVAIPILGRASAPADQQPRGRYRLRDTAKEALPTSAPGRPHELGDSNDGAGQISVADQNRASNARTRQLKAERENASKNEKHEPAPRLKSIKEYLEAKGLNYQRVELQDSHMELLRNQKLGR